MKREGELFAALKSVVSKLEPNEAKPMFTLHEARRELKLRPEVLARWISVGRIECVRIRGRRMISRIELSKHLD